MIGAPNKNKKKQFALKLQKDRNKIINKHTKPIKLVLNHLLNEVINKRKFKNENIKNVILSYKKEFQIIIKNIYRESFKKFGRYLHNSIKNDDNNKKYCNIYFEKKQEFDEFELDIYNDYEYYSDLHTNYILDTLQNQFIFYDKQATKLYYKELQEKIDKLANLEKNFITYGISTIITNTILKNNIEKNNIEKLQKDIQDDKQNQIKEVVNIFKELIQQNIINQSSERIANQETLFAESFTRQKEAEYIQEEQKRQVYKEWNSMFLETSRPSHMDASGQKKKVEEYFAVARPSTGIIEYGLQPKDENFSLDNKINCYCFIIYFVE